VSLARRGGRDVLLQGGSVHRFGEGAYVICRRTGRRGIVSSHLDRRAGVDRYYVDWEGGSDMSLMGEIDLDASEPFASRRIGSRWYFEQEPRR
jgi:hypothetical protein